MQIYYTTNILAHYLHLWYYLNAYILTINTMRIFNNTSSANTPWIRLNLLKEKISSLSPNQQKTIDTATCTYLRWLRSQRKMLKWWSTELIQNKNLATTLMRAIDFVFDREMNMFLDNYYDTGEYRLLADFSLTLIEWFSQLPTFSHNNDKTDAAEMVSNIINKSE